MIDISDGLASEILHICKNSKKGCAIFEDKLPIDTLAYNTAMDFKLIPSTVALNGGEDYELLFTIDQNIMTLSDKSKMFPLSAILQTKTKAVILFPTTKNQSPLMHKAGMLI